MFFKKKQEAKTKSYYRVYVDNKVLISVNLRQALSLPYVPPIGSTIRLSSGLYRCINVHADHRGTIDENNDCIRVDLEKIGET